MDATFETAKAEWLPKPNVNGVFKARRHKGGAWTDELVIQFHVREKLPVNQLTEADIIPAHINGVKTDVIASNPVLAITGRKYAAVQGGMSLGVAENYAAGTLGIVVIDSIHGAVGITCAHCVLVGGSSPLITGTPIYPATEDGGSIATDQIGLVLSWDIHTVDVAGIKLNYPYGLSIFNTEFVPVGSRIPQIGDVLRKLGRTTYLTEGKVSGSGSIGADYSAFGLGTINHDMFFLVPNGSNPAERIVAGGDSGSLWYYPDSNEGGAIVVSIAVDSNITYATRFDTSLSFAGVTNPTLPSIISSERRGSVNLIVPANHDLKGAMGLSGSSVPFVTRLTAFSQIGDYRALQDIYAEAGVTFIPIGGTAPTGGTMPTGGTTTAPDDGAQMTWGDYDGTFATE